MKNPKHETPGLQSIIELHRSFIEAAQLNPNNWLLHRDQVVEVFQRDVSWLGVESAMRLVKSFDPQNVGLIRFVRLTATLTAALQPAMIELASTFNRVRNKIHVTDENREELDCMSELIVIRFLHSLYEECAGGTTLRVALVNGNETAHTPAVGAAEEAKSSQQVRQTFTMQQLAVGMKLEDLPELFSCCVASVDDELTIERQVQPLMEHLHQEAQKRSFLASIEGDAFTNPLSYGASSSSSSSSIPLSADSKTLLKYPLLKSAVTLARVSQEELIEALQLPQHKPFLMEFIRQVRTFRKMAAPYTFKNSVNLDDAIHHYAQTNLD